MPHIRVLLNKENKDIVSWYKKHKTDIRDIAAKVTGYKAEDIAVIGELLDPGVCANILDFEVVLLTGKKKYHQADLVSQGMMTSLRELGIEDNDFLKPEGWGVWTKPNRDTIYVAGSDVF